MLQATTGHRVEESLYEFIGDAGPLTARELAGFAGTSEPRAEAWLRTQATAGFLHRDESGLYSTSCPWPRAGF